MRRDLVVAIHAGYWGLYLVLTALVLVMIQVPHRTAGLGLVVLEAWPLLLLAVAPNVFSFYSAYALLFRPFLARKRFVPLLLGVAATSGSAAVVGLVLALLLFGPGQPAFRDPAEGIAVTISFGSLAAVHAGAALVTHGFITWYTDLHARAELTRRTHETELALIRSRLDPHFLFNTLNNIDVLITKNPKAASAYLSRLSDIMRFVLYAKSDTIPLVDEISYIEKYIALESIRTRCPASVSLDVIGDPAGITIAPLTLIPFIENAFKHSEGLRESGAIASRLIIDGRRLTFECSNRCRPTAAAGQGDGGIGAGLVRRRLELLYPERHALQTVIQEGRYAVRLTIDA